MHVARVCGHGLWQAPCVLGWNSGRYCTTAADAANRSRLLAFADANNIHSSSGWKKTTLRQLREGGCGDMLVQYGSKQALLSRLLPEALEARRNSLSDTRAKRRAALDSLRERHAISSPSDWRGVTLAEVRAACGRAAVDRFGSVAALLKDAYPELESVPESVLRSVTRARRYWQDHENRKSALEEIGGRLGVKQLSDWKAVRFTDIRKEGGGSLLNLYNNSVFAMLKDLHPEAEELEERRCRRNMPHRYWASMENRRQFLLEVAEELDVRTAADWGRVLNADVARLGGARLLQLYGDSLFQAVQELLPEVGLKEQHRLRAKKGHWDSRAEARRFLDDFAERKSIRSPEQWKSVVEEDLKQAGGSTLLKKHSNFFSLLCFAYPEVRWDAFECRHRLPVDYWSDDEHVKSFMESLVALHDIRGEEDWLRISNEQVREAGGGGLLKRMSLLEAASRSFPGLNLTDNDALGRTKKRAVQGTLLRQLRGLMEPMPVPLANQSL